MVFQTNEVVNLHGGSNYFCYYVEQETDYMKYETVLQAGTKSVGVI